MLIEIILGATAGSLLLGGLGLWYNNKQKTLPPVLEDDNFSESDKENNIRKELDRKLRHALFEAERNERLCLNQLKDLYRRQLELLENVGTASHVEVKNKPLFHGFHHKLNQERLFFYEKEINQDVDFHIIEDTRQTVREYQEQIDLLHAQATFFKRLQISHQENVDRLQGVLDEDEKLKTLQKHKSFLEEGKSKEEFDQKLIYSALQLQTIQEELEHQEACLAEYIKLQRELSDNENKFRTEIERLTKDVDLDE